MTWYRILATIVEGEAKRFADFLEALSQGEEYGVEINSPGGSVSEGMYIYRKMLTRPPTTALIHEANSMASLIAQAAKVRVMADGGHMALHNPHVTVNASAKELAEIGEYVGALEHEMRGIYAKRAKASQKIVGDLMTAQKPLSAKEAQENGLIDEIRPAVEMAAMLTISLDPQPKKESAMGFKQLLAKLLGLPEASLTVTATGEATAETQALLEAKAALLNQREQELNQQAQVTAKSELIATAMKEGRLTEAQSKLEAIAKLDLASLKALVESLPQTVPLARIDTAGMAIPSGTTFTPEQAKILKNLKADPAKASLIPIPANGVLRYTVEN
jgi:ATP-dependent protease ClpP protease subunit